MNLTDARSQIQGSVAAGFESIRSLYEKEIRTMAEENTQLCIYYRGEKVVDLWSSASSEPSFSGDSLVNVFSSGKSLESVAVAMLVDRGALDYNTPITDYWPEFGQGGKQDLTLADVMRHEGGMAAFTTSIDPDDLHAAKIKENRMGQVIEAEPLRFPGGGRGPREYHAVTRGWIVNEIFRRADPNGRTIGEFLREEVSGPLEADVFIGVTESELGRISKVRPLAWSFVFLQSLKPKALGRRLKHGFFDIVYRLFKVIPMIRKSTMRNSPPPFKGMGRDPDFFNSKTISMGETPSAGAKASARGLAKIAAVMAAKGKWSDKQYLSDPGWRAMHRDAIRAEMSFCQSNFTQAGVNFFTEPQPYWNRLDRDLNEGREGFYGWMGLGGSIFQWHPEHEIGFSFVPTALHMIDIFNERGKVYQAEVLRCVNLAAGN